MNSIYSILFFILQKKNHQWKSTPWLRISFHACITYRSRAAPIPTWIIQSLYMWPWAYTSYDIKQNSVDILLIHQRIHSADYYLSIYMVQTFISSLSFPYSFFFFVFLYFGHAFLLKFDQTHTYNMFIINSLPRVCCHCIGCLCKSNWCLSEIKYLISFLNF